MVIKTARWTFWRSGTQRGWLMLVAVLLAGCGRGATIDVDDEPPPSTDTSFERLPALLTGITSAGEVLLYEGLPSEFWEPELRQQEFAQKETIKLHGHPVYEELLPVQEKDSSRLTALFSAKESFAKYRSQKTCGGFQTEFAVEWKTGGATTLALICLECGEVKLFGPEGELYCDLKPEVVLELKELLHPYQVQNPAPQPL